MSVGETRGTGDSVRFGLKWTTLSMAISRAIRFLSMIVLARLLVPEMFGLVAMANVTVSIVGVVRDVGFGAAYIQRQFESAAAERVGANTVFFLILGTNLVLFLAISAATPQIAAFFGVSGSEWVLQAVFVVFLIDGVASGPGLVLRKNLQFGKLAVVEIIATVAYGAVSITLAITGQGVWSLVFGQITYAICRAVALYSSAKWAPRLEFDRSIASRLFQYGKYLWGFSAVSAIGDSLDRLIVGRFLGAGSLGIYGLAYNLCNLPATQISFLINRIAFPALSKIQDDQAALRRALLKTLSHVSIMSVPLSFGFLSVADEFIVMVYGEKWSAAVPVAQVLVFYSMVLALSSVTGPTFQATGRPHILLYTSILHHLLQLILLIFLVRYGIVGVAVAVVIPVAVSGVIAFSLIKVYLKVKLTELLEATGRATLVSVVMYGAVKASQNFCYEGLDMNRATVLVVSAVVGVFIYVTGSFLINRAVLQEFLTTVKQVASAKGSLR